MNLCKTISVAVLSVLFVATGSVHAGVKSRQHKPTCSKAHKQSVSSCSSSSSLSSSSLSSSSSSSSSSCSNNTCREKGCCDCTVITCLPYTIFKSGKYAIDRDLFYNNLDSGHVGIEVQANDVEIDLCRHSITIAQGSPGTIIRVNNYDNVFVHNGTLKGAIPVTNSVTTDLRGITLEGVHSSKFDDLYFKDLRQGIFLPAGFENSMLTLTNSNFTNMFSREPVSDPDFNSNEWSGSGLAGFKLKGMNVDNCQFEWDEDGGPFPLYGNAGIGLVGVVAPYDGECYDLVIRNCNLINCTGGFLFFPEGNSHGSYVIEDCNFLLSSKAETETFFTGLFVCCSSPDCTCRSIRVSGCNFTAREPMCQERTGINIASGHSVLVEKCTFSIPNVVQYDNVPGHSIAVGLSEEGSIANNVIIRECLFSGSTAAPENAPSVRRHVGLYKTRSALVEECQFTDACNEAVFISVLHDVNTFATVRNNVFSNNPGTAVWVDENVVGTVIQGNIFRQNGIGVELDLQSTQTVISDNLFHFNKVHIEKDPSSMNNTIVDNLQTDTDLYLQGCCLPECAGVFSQVPKAQKAKLFKQTKK